MSLSRNVLKLTTSRAGSTVVGLIVAPIIARMYMPKDFGVLQIFISIMGVFSVAACLRYELSIPLAKNDEEASASFALSVIISLIFSLIVLAIIPLLGSRIATWFKSPDLQMFLWLLPIAILIGSLRQSLQYWAAYKMRFGIMAWAGFVSAVVGGLTPIGWYFVYGRSPAGLLVAIFTGGAITVLILLLPLFQRLIDGFKKGGLRSIVNVAKYHRNFPIYATWASLVNTLSSQMPTFVLGVYFPVKVVGYYSLANRIIGLPVSLLGSTITEVFYPTASKEYHKTGDISEIVRSTVRRLAQIGIFPMVVVGFSGATLLGFVLGSEWVEAGIYAQILSIAVLSQFITSPMTMIFPLKLYQDKGLIYNVVLALSRFLALFGTSQINNPKITLGAYAITSFTVYILTFAWLLHLSHVSVWWGLKIMLKYTLGSALLLLPTLFLVRGGHGIFTILASLAIETILYLWILFKMDVSLRVGVSSIFYGKKITKDS